MTESFPTPIQLNDNPELAALRLLKTNLDVAELALVAVYPDASEPSYWEHCRSEQEAFASAILHQLDALGAMLNDYVESIRRLHEERQRQLSTMDIEF